MQTPDGVKCFLPQNSGLVAKIGTLSTTPTAKFYGIMFRDHINSALNCVNYLLPLRVSFFFNFMQISNCCLRCGAILFCVRQMQDQESPLLQLLKSYFVVETLFVSQCLASEMPESPLSFLEHLGAGQHRTVGKFSLYLSNFSYIYRHSRHG